MSESPASRRRGRPPLSSKPEVADDGSDLVAGAEPIRQPVRPPLREDDKTRAARRAAEIRDHLGGFAEEGSDEFYVDPADIPVGFEYEWKRHTVLGAEDPAYTVSLYRMGWEPVPASRHPAYMPVGEKYETITRKGMILMERPKEINDESRARELRKARQQVQQKEAQLNDTKPGEFGRDDERARAKIRKFYEAMPVPE